MDQKTTGRPDISVIIPVFNEEGNVEPLYGQLKSVLEKLDKTYEMLFIDDGSTDSTYDNISKISDPSLTVIRFQRNFGKASALSCGFSRARGKIVITMDGDLQDDPKEIPRFLDALKTYEVVSGWKQKRNDPASKRIPSKFFNALTGILTGVHLNDFNCGFKAYRSYVVKNISLYGGMHRYIPVIAHIKGYSVGEIAVEHRPRINGKSKYGTRRLFAGLFDLITIKFLMTYSKKPMYIFGSLGVLFGALGSVICIYLFYIWLLGTHIGNRPLLSLGVLLVVIGIQFMAIGLIGELIISTKNSNDWVIRMD
jgi:glycosyltransferase involved in cell wall biosynthesis